MSAGLLINENNIYGIVNPPPAPTAYNPKSWQTVNSAAVNWATFVDLSSNFYTLTNGADAALDTIKELSDYLTDGNITGGLVTSLAAKAPLDAPTFTGDVTLSANKSLIITTNNGTDGLFLGGTSTAHLITATAAELNFCVGLTGGTLQTQFAAKAPHVNPTFTGIVTLPTIDSNSGDTSAATKKYVDDNTSGAITGAASTIKTADLSISKALVSNGSGKVAVSAVTSIELGHLSGVTSGVQAQITARAAKGANSDITAITGLTTMLAITQGGTGAATAPLARTALGVDIAGTDNSTPVSLATVTGNYLTISGQAITAGTVPVALGGSGATTASDARTGLGVAIGSDVQAYHANLADIAGLSKTANNFIVADGSNFTLKTAADSRTALGLGALATAATINNANWTADGADLALVNGGTGASTAAAARTNLGVAIGSDVQAYDAGLLSIAALTTAANKMIYATAADTYAVADLTAAGRALLDDADAAAQRTTLGLGTGSDVVFNQVTAALIGNASTATNLAGSQTAQFVYAAPNGNNGTAGFRALLASDIPTLNQSTTGNAATATDLAGTKAVNFVYAGPGSGVAAAAPSFRALVAGDIPTLNQATTGNADTATKITSITNSNIVQLTETQTLTNKTLTSPTITGTGAIAGTFTGDLTGNVTGDVTGNVTGDLTGNAATASAADGGSALELALAAKATSASPTFTGVVTLPAITTSSAATSAATKAYVDSVASGLDTKESVRVATTAAGTLASSFANGETVDGITLATGDRILIKTQADGSENGIYTVNASGAPTRATDFDTDAEVTAGSFTFVEEGTTNANAGFVLSTTGAITVGTTALSFTQFSSSATVTAGTGITKTGSTLSVDAAQTQITSVGTLSALTVGGNLTVSDGAYDLDVASHDGSNGLKLGGTLITATAAQLNYVDDVTSGIQSQLDAKGTGSVSSLSDLSITATTAELNILDGSATTQATVTLADGDGVVISEGDVMTQCLVSDFKTYVADLTLTTAAQAAITSVGTLTSLKIANDATIGSAGDADAITIAADGVCTFSAGISALNGVTGNVTGALTGNADTATDLAGTKAVNFVYAGPGSGDAAAPSFRALVAGDIPDLNQDTTGTAANLSGSQTANFVYAGPGSGDAAAPSFRALIASDIPTLNQHTSGTAATVTGAAQTAITSVGTLTALTVDDVAIDGKVITMTGSTGDTAVLTVAEHGALTITTTDATAEGANITITADGTAELAGTTVTLNSSGGITLDADNGTITFSDGGNSLGTITSAGYSGNAATASSITGLNASVSDLNILEGVTAVAAELNKLAGLTTSKTELGVLDGDAVSGRATVPLAGGDGVVINDNGTMKQCLVSDFKTYVADLTLTTAAQAGITSVGTLSALTVGGNLTVSDGAYDLDVASHDGINGLKLGGTLITASAVELNYVDGVSSGIQSQLDDKANLASPTLTGAPLAPTATDGTNTTQLATTQFVTTAIANTDVSNATNLATASKIVKRDSSGGAAFETVTCTVLTTGTGSGVGASVTDLTTRVTALENSVKITSVAPTTSTVGVAGDMLIKSDGATMYVLPSITGPANNYSYNWRQVSLGAI
jgi:hypothetical protein|uniref:Tail protein n=1 Tax=viral metagenome TaxID=1070528 RepID=A0A6C0IQK8_9ZZZZ